MHFGKIIISIASLLGIASSFLPWKLETVLGEKATTTGINSGVLLKSMQWGDGWLTVILFALILLLSLTGKKAAPVGIFKGVTILLLSAGVLFVTVSGLLLMQKQSVNLPGSNLSLQVSAGYGLYLTLLCSIATELAVVVSFVKRQAAGNR